MAYPAVPSVRLRDLIESEERPLIEVEAGHAIAEPTGEVIAPSIVDLIRCLQWVFVDTRAIRSSIPEQQHDIDQVRALLDQERIDTRQIYASIRAARLKRALIYGMAH